MKLRRLFALMVCVLMVAALLPLGVAAQEEEEEPVGSWERSDRSRWTEARRDREKNRLPVSQAITDMRPQCRSPRSPGNSLTASSPT